MKIPGLGPKSIKILQDLVQIIFLHSRLQSLLYEVGCFFGVFFLSKKSLSPLVFAFLRWVWLFKKQFFERNIDFFSGVFFSKAPLMEMWGAKTHLPLRILILAEEQMRIQNSQSEFPLLKGWMSA